MARYVFPRTMYETAEMRRRARLGKKASPWAKGTNCGTKRAARIRENFDKKGEGNANR